MLAYATRHFSLAVPVILIVAVLAFLLMHALPGDPASVMAGSDASPAEIERIRVQLGLDRPVIEQLLLWGWNLLHGDFGRSLTLNQPVMSAVVERAPVTLSLSLLALAITVPISLVLGALAAYRRGTAVDGIVMVLALAGVSVPGFWLGILGITLFSVKLGWVPSSGYVPLSSGIGPWFASIILPATVLAFFQIGFLARITRATMLEVFEQEFIRAARARGVGEWRIVSKHVLRNGLLIIVTACGVILTMLISGAVVTETVFALPGIGRLVVQGVFARDYPLIQGVLIIIALVLVVVNILVDILYRLIDPRLR